MTISEVCACVSPEKSDGGGRMLADRKCQICYGEGALLINVSHDPPPAPLPNCDWNAILDGSEEEGPTGYGATQDLAIANLLMQLDEKVQERPDEPRGGCLKCR